jgi:K+-transporting ATPase ATPase B chain
MKVPLPESAPVIQGSGGDKSSVTGGTKVLSDKIKVIVTNEPGESFLDKMIALVEGASRQKTPNEIALTILLAAFTLIFVIVCVTLKPFADYANAPITIALFHFCLFDSNNDWRFDWDCRNGQGFACQCNYQIRKAVETAGDIDVLLLDKTGTITIGNRKATRFIQQRNLEDDFIKSAVLSSLADDTKAKVLWNWQELKWQKTYLLKVLL